MFDAHGDLVTVDVRPSSYPLKGISKSKLQSIVGSFLQENYPRECILEEFTVPGTKSTVDFFLPKIGIAVEIDGRQHNQFTSHFHGNKLENKFAKQKIRDTIKEYWCELNGFKLIRIFKEEDIKCLL